MPTTSTNALFRRMDSVYTELRYELPVWALKEFSLPSIRSPRWIRCCRKRCDAATINRHQHPKRKQFWTAADRALTAGIVIGLEDAMTDKPQPPGRMESYRPSVRLLSSNKTGSPNPVAEQTRESVL